MPYCARNILVEKDFNRYGLVEINLPEPGDVIPSSFPDWLKGHLQSYLDSPEPKEPRDIDHIPSHDELETIIMDWNDFWEWIPKIKMSLEELELVAQEATWISLPLWRKAIQV